MNKTQQSNVADVTIYARANGYTGTDKVLVSKGIVISHHNKSWHEFCHECRVESAKRERDTTN